MKERKPYTMTRPRERWTEEEHRLFLEAVQLYGRAWKKIESHIGSKTTVQIRSHAQKFFAKFERESASGVPASNGEQTSTQDTTSPDLASNGSALSETFQIPPPRHKRKPTNPYPKKPSPDVNSYTDELGRPTGSEVYPKLAPDHHNWAPPSVESYKHFVRPELYQLGSSVTPPTGAYPPSATSHNFSTKEYYSEARYGHADSHSQHEVHQVQKRTYDKEPSRTHAGAQHSSASSMRTAEEPQTSGQSHNMYSPELAMSVLQQLGQVPAFAVAFEAAAAAALSVVMSGGIDAPKLPQDQPCASSSKSVERSPVTPNFSQPQPSSPVIGKTVLSARSSTGDPVHMATSNSSLTPVWNKHFTRNAALGSSTSSLGHTQLAPVSSSSGLSYSTGQAVSRNRSRGSSPSLQTGDAVYGEQEEGSVDGPGQKKDRTHGTSTLMSATRSAYRAEPNYDSQPSPGGPNSCFARWKPKTSNPSSYTHASSSNNNDLELYKNYDSKARAYTTHPPSQASHFSQDRVAAAAAMLELVRGVPSASGIKGQPVSWMHPWPAHPNKLGQFMSSKPPE